MVLERGKSRRVVALLASDTHILAAPVNRLALLVGLDDVSDEQFVVPPVEEEEPGRVRRLLVEDEALHRRHRLEVALLVIDDGVGVGAVEQGLGRRLRCTPDHERQSAEEDQDDGQRPELPEHGVPCETDNLHDVLLGCGSEHEVVQVVDVVLTTFPLERLLFQVLPWNWFPVLLEVGRFEKLSDGEPGFLQVIHHGDADE